MNASCRCVSAVSFIQLSCPNKTLLWIICCKTHSASHPKSLRSSLFCLTSSGKPKTDWRVCSKNSFILTLREFDRFLNWVWPAARYSRTTSSDIMLLLSDCRLWCCYIILFPVKTQYQKAPPCWITLEVRDGMRESGWLLLSQSLFWSPAEPAVS